MAFVASDYLAGRSALLSRLSASRAAALDRLTAARGTLLDNLSRLNGRVGGTQYQTFSSGNILPGDDADGSWYQLAAATNFAVTRVIFSVERWNHSGGVSYRYFDLGTGAAGSETVLVPDVSLTFMGNNVSLRVAVPSGTRVAFRCRVKGTPYSEYWNVKGSLMG